MQSRFIFRFCLFWIGQSQSDVAQISNQCLDDNQLLKQFYPHFVQALMLPLATKSIRAS